MDLSTSGPLGFASTTSTAALHTAYGIAGLLRQRDPVRVPPEEPAGAENNRALASAYRNLGRPTAASIPLRPESLPASSLGLGG